MHDPYEDEARERWGDTPAYQQSAARTARYTEQDWADVKAEGEAAAQRYAEVFRAGLPADSTEAMDAAEAHRLHIHERFYDLTPEVHVSLGEMYVADSRFTEYYERLAPGLAVFVRDAILANAERVRA